MDCVFCKIIDKEIPAGIIYENDWAIVFQDIKPIAPVHVLIVPKKHISSVNHLEAGDEELIGNLLLIARKIAAKQGIAESGYRLIFNIGKDAGQTVDHIHLHLIGGERLPWA